jgi:hypothetical protein
MKPELPVEAFLAGYPLPMRTLAEDLRAVVRAAVPGAVERLRLGWRLIGYDVPYGRRWRYFAYVAPETEHVHLGFEYGASMSDPHRMLEGAHLNLRQVRFLTFRAGDELPVEALMGLVHEAARVARLPASERAFLALDSAVDQEVQPSEH